MNIVFKNKAILTTVIATIFIVVGGALILSKGSKNTSEVAPSISPNSYKYFYGQGCPHCENVEKFIETWDKKDSISITKMEVWYNNENAKIIAGEAEKCGISKNDLSVPLLVTPDGKCLSGDTSIIDYFKNIK